MKGLQPKGIARRNKMLLAAIQLFLDQGYEKTTTAQIARAAGMSPTSFFAAFENKEALLLTLTQIMFEISLQRRGHLQRIWSRLWCTALKRHCRYI